MNLEIQRKATSSTITVPGVKDLTIEVGVAALSHAFVRINSRHVALYGNAEWEVRCNPELETGPSWTVTEMNVKQPSWAFNFVHTMRDVTLNLTNNPDFLDPIALALVLVAIGKELEHHAMTSKEKQEAKAALESRLRLIEDTANHRDETYFNELEPCQNCGKPGTLYSINPLNPRFFVDCSGCSNTTQKFQDKELAIIAWNYPKSRTLEPGGSDDKL